MKRFNTGLVLAGMAALALLFVIGFTGCANGTASAALGDDGNDTNGPGSGGFPWTPDSTNVDNPAYGYMKSSTADAVFNTNTTSGGVTIIGFKSTAELAKYLGTSAPAASVLAAGPLFAVVSGGTSTFKIAKIGGEDVIGIKDKAFSPGEGAAYNREKDITLVVGKIELPATIETLGTDLFVGVKAAVEVDIPKAVVDAIVASAGDDADEATVLAAVIGETEAVTVVKEDGGSASTVIKGAPRYWKPWRPPTATQR
jgi:hypothetical protein